jgi:MFS family permease
VFCPKYIAETSPIEVKGTAGSLTQICITFGILIAFAGGSLFKQETDAERLFFIDVMFIIPIVLSILQVFLLIVVFPYDTPSVLNSWGQKAKLREFLNKIYKPEYVDDIIMEIGGNAGESDDLAPATLTYGDVFCGPLYRKATLVGISLAAFQQMTGINIIMFYSNTIFESGTSMDPNTITTLVGTVNFLATLVGMYLLSIAGRRTIMLWNQVLLSAVLILLGWLSL